MECEPLHIRDEHQCVDCTGVYPEWNMQQLLPQQMTMEELVTYHATHTSLWICVDCLAERLNPLPMEPL